MAKEVRTRFAPSPTGHMHVGGARTALYNMLYAKKYGGKYILRIEDTDVVRSTEASTQSMIKDLAWLGLHWDEGPNPNGGMQDIGPHAPYRQSQRLKIYQEHAERLLNAGLAYYDFRSDEELEALKNEAIALKRPHQIEPPKDVLPVDEARRRISKGEKAAVRFKTGERRDYFLNDLIRGEVRFPSDMVGDFICLRSNGMPVYNFSCVIDDALMGLTHIFRAEEHLSNTLRQMMLFQAFGYELPQFGHLSIIQGKDHQKLSKRHGAASVDEYKAKGYLPEALNNFLLLLGWSSPKGQEFMTVEEMIEQFSHERFNPAPAVFDDAKLNWMNSTHLRALPNDELWRRVEPFLLEAGLHIIGDDAWKSEALNAFKTSMVTLTDAVTLFRPLDDKKYQLHESAQEVFGWPDTKKVWESWKAALNEVAKERVTEAEFNALQDRVKEQTGTKGKNLFQPIRVAIIGQPQGTELKILVPLLTKKSLINRVDQCLAKI